MKFRTIIYFLLIFFALGAFKADGQNAVEFGGVLIAQNPIAVISSGGYVSVNGQIPGTPVSTRNATGQPIAANLHFGDVSPNGILSRRVIIRMPIRISANCNYKVALQRISLNNMTVKPSDIGFSIGNARPQIAGSPKLTANAAVINVLGNFGFDVTTATVVNGSPRYQSTLTDISENLTPVLTGVPTIKAGSAGEDANSILIDLIFVIVPQYYSQTDASHLKLNLIISPQ